MESNLTAKETDEKANYQIKADTHHSIESNKYLVRKCSIVPNREGTLKINNDENND